MFHGFLVILDKFQCTIYVIEIRVFWLKSIKSFHYRISQNSIYDSEHVGLRSIAYDACTEAPDLNLRRCIDYIEIFIAFFSP
jgi:hypothetical protein